jgi:hypothetical protein
MSGPQAGEASYHDVVAMFWHIASPKPRRRWPAWIVPQLCAIGRCRWSLLLLSPVNHRRCQPGGGRPGSPL